MVRLEWPCVFPLRISNSIAFVDPRSIDLYKWKQPDPDMPPRTTEQREALPTGGL